MADVGRLPYVMSFRERCKLLLSGGCCDARANKFAAVFAGVAGVSLGLAADASAVPRCRVPVEGFATATGILGAGSAKARVEARHKWQAIVANLYGRRYADFWNAQNVQWDCKKGAILLAKCVVVAKPCRY
jgi:hypothetical protein